MLQSRPDERGGSARQDERISAAVVVVFCSRGGEQQQQQQQQQQQCRQYVTVVYKIDKVEHAVPRRSGARGFSALW